MAQQQAQGLVQVKASHIASAKCPCQLWVSVTVSVSEAKFYDLPESDRLFLD